MKIEAILVWASPRDWGMDLQLLIDLLLSEKGYLGTISLLNGNPRLQNHGYLQDSQPVIHSRSRDTRKVHSALLSMASGLQERMVRR